MIGQNCISVRSRAYAAAELVRWSDILCPVIILHNDCDEEGAEGDLPSPPSDGD